MSNIPSDNPIGNIFSKFMGDNSTKNVSEFLLKASQGIPYVGGVSAGLHKFDKYGILANIKDYSITFDAKNARGLGSLIGSRNFMFAGNYNTSLADTFEKISTKYRAGLAFNRTNNQLFLLSESGRQYALPVQQNAFGLESGIVNKGGIRRGAFRAHILGSGEETYSNLYYKEVNRLLDQNLSEDAFFKALRRIDKTVIGFGVHGGEVRLGSLLGPVGSIRSMEQSLITAKKFGARARVIAASKDNPIFKEIAGEFKSFNEATYAINYMLKSMGGWGVPKTLPGSGDISWLTDVDNTSEALTLAWNKYHAFHSFQSKLAETLGYAGYHHIVKPEDLLGLKGLVIPSSIGKALFGEFSPEHNRAAYKGGFGAFHESVITGSQRKLIQKLGGSTLPTHMLGSEFGLFGDASNSITRRAFNVAVVDEKNILSELLLTDDSGALLTERGMAETQRKLHLGGFKVRNPSEGLIDALHQLTGKTPYMGELNIASKLDITRKDIISAQEAIEWTKNRLSDVKWRELTPEQREAIKKENRIFWSTITDKQKALMKVIRASGKNYGIFDYIVEKNLPISIGIKHGGNGLQISFKTSRNATSGIAEMLFEGGVRLTANAVAPGHEYEGALKELSRQGAHLVITKSLYNKVEGDIRYVSNFMAVMQKHGFHKDAIEVIGLGAQLEKHGNMEIALISSHKEAADKARAYVANLSTSRVASKIKLARRINHGARVAKISSMFRELTGKSVRMFTLNASLRADERLDLNSFKAVRFGPGKMRTLAFNSKLMGFSDPNLDPVFSTIASNWKGMMLNAGLHFDFDPTSSVRGYIQGLHSPGSLPNAANTISFRSGEAYLGGERLKTLPGLSQFSARVGGVSPEMLEGTILDNKLRNRLLYIDLGKEFDIIGSKGRFLPLPMMMSRVGQTTGRYLVNKDHNFYGYMELLEAMHRGETDLGKNITKAVKKTLRAMVGKGGILEKMNTIHFPASMAFRSVANPYHSYSDLFNTEGMFEATISRKAFKEELLKKQGLNPKQIQRMLDIAEKKDFTYVMIGADPSQRGEHLGTMLKLKFTDKVIPGEDNVIHAQISPILKKLFERDTDRDRMIMILMEAFDDPRLTPEEFEKRIAKQTLNTSPSLSYLKKYFTDPIVDRGDKQVVMDEMFGKYLGQKGMASIPFTMARPNDAFMSVLMNEGEEGLKKYGVRLSPASSESLAYITRHFKDDVGRQGAAMALNQFLFQAGVKKSGEKGGLENISKVLLEVANEARASKTVDIPNIEAKLTEHFEKFIKDADINRFWGAGAKIFEDTGLEKESLARLTAGLERGAAMEAGRDTIVKAAARLMALNIGVGVAARAASGGNISTVDELFEGDGFNITESNFLKRIAGPILGFITRKQESGIAKEIEEAAATNKNATKLLKNLGEAAHGFGASLVKFAESKYAAPAALAVAAAGVYGYMNRPDLDNVPLPPNVDNKAPADYGPTVPDYSNVAYINSSPNISRTTRTHTRRNFNNINSNYFSSSTNSRISIEDKVSPMSPWLIRQQMNKVSESDFSY